LSVAEVVDRMRSLLDDGMHHAEARARLDREFEALSRILGL
jgi:hypothetical protein